MKTLSFEPPMHLTLMTFFSRFQKNMPPLTRHVEQSDQSTPRHIGHYSSITGQVKVDGPRVVFHCRQGEGSCLTVTVFRGSFSHAN
ncbi:hypothetical protein GDO78_016521 [Eleutherodactylus coqui]|uniref:Uncharacterized protein n=1 Tax=Eleutherodactylus coqui TaxID=57060 RepID=A0A8J6ER52_ELECQ|nr:hypothetical protein GDO78_016521 [Eleutherodactylus coqui]